MPSSTAHGYPYPVPGDPLADTDVRIQALADAIEDKLTGFGNAALTTSAAPTSTTNVTLHSSINLTITSPGTAAKYVITLDADVNLTAAGTNIIECLVDGVAQTVSIVLTGAISHRAALSKSWVVTGLSAGAHTITFRTRSGGAYTTTVLLDNTISRYRQVA